VTKLFHWARSSRALFNALWQMTKTSHSTRSMQRRQRNFESSVYRIVIQSNRALTFIKWKANLRSHGVFASEDGMNVCGKQVELSVDFFFGRIIPHIFLTKEPKYVCNDWMDSAKHILLLPHEAASKFSHSTWRIFSGLIRLGYWQRNHLIIASKENL
jgi:hypothetical protein